MTRIKLDFVEFRDTLPSGVSFIQAPSGFQLALLPGLGVVEVIEDGGRALLYPLDLVLRMRPAPEEIVLEAKANEGAAVARKPGRPRAAVAGSGTPPPGE